jgi:V-type H+-transporting ATPase subunit a
VSGLQIEHV